MHDTPDRDVLLAVMAGLGVFALLAVGVLGVAISMLLVAPGWQQVAQPVIVAAVATAPALVETPTMAPTATPFLVALPVVVGPPVDTPTAIPTATPTIAPADTPAGLPSPLATVAPIPPLPVVPVAPALATLPPAPTLPPPTLTPMPLPPTATPLPAPTATLTGWWTERRGYVFASDCPCDQGNTLNCGNFPDGQAAQACYLRCMELVGDDVHELDRDVDGSACEWSW